MLRFAAAFGCVLEDVFFIVVAFRRIRFSSVDDPDHVTALGEAYQDQTPSGRCADDDFAPLADGVIRIVMDSRERIFEYGDRFLKRNALLFGVGCRLPGIPTESHERSLRQRFCRTGSDQFQSPRASGGALEQVLCAARVIPQPTRRAADRHRRVETALHGHVRNAFRAANLQLLLLSGSGSSVVPGVSAAEIYVPRALAPRFRRLRHAPTGVSCNRRVTAGTREFAAPGREVRA